MRHTAIKRAELHSARTWWVTQPEFRDYAAAFDPEGRYLYFLSLRTFDPMYDAVQFELSFPRAARPSLVALQAGGPPPFEPAFRGLKPGALAAADTAPAALPAIEPEGLGRVAAFPVPEGRFSQIAGMARCKVVWIAQPVIGAHGRGGHKESPGRLEVFDFDTAEVKTLLPQADHFAAAADGHTLLVRTARELRAIDATRAADDAGRPGGPPADGKPSRQSGLIDLARARPSVDPPAEWAQMLAEVGRLQRDHFWMADMSGIN